jgi:hypothetical protein
VVGVNMHKGRSWWSICSAGVLQLGSTGSRHAIRILIRLTRTPARPLFPKFERERLNQVNPPQSEFFSEICPTANLLLTKVKIQA